MIRRGSSDPKSGDLSMLDESVLDSDPSDIVWNDETIPR